MDQALMDSANRSGHDIIYPVFILIFLVPCSSRQIFSCAKSNSLLFLNYIAGRKSHPLWEHCTKAIFQRKNKIKMLRLSTQNFFIFCLGVWAIFGEKKTKQKTFTVKTALHIQLLRKLKPDGHWLHRLFLRIFSKNMFT